MRIGIVLFCLVWVSPILSRCATNDAMLPALIDLIHDSEDPQFQLDILRGMRDGLQGRTAVPMPAGWDSLSKKLEQSSNTEVRELAQSLSLQFGSATALAQLRATLVNRSADSAVRLRALVALGNARDPTLPAILREIIATDSAIRGAGLRALAAYEDSQTPPTLIGLYPKLDTSERRDALSTLISRPAYARALLTAIATNVIPLADLALDQIRHLRQIQDPTLQTQLEKLWGLARETPTEKLREIASVKAMIQKDGYGEARRGRAVYNRICHQCHTLFDSGGKVGPELTGGNRTDLDYVLQNVIDPNAVVPNDYRSWNLETKDERLISGILSQQNDRAVTLLVPGETIIIPRTEIRSLIQGELSLMPEGLLQTLPTNDIRDLLAYLRSPTQVSLP